MNRLPQTDADRQPLLLRRLSGRIGLSARLLVLTILFVMLAEVLIYVPSVANFRRNWLNDRLAAAQIAALVLDAAPEERLSEELEARLLAGVGAEAIAVRGGGLRRLLAAGDVPHEVDKTVDLRDAAWQTLIVDAFDVLVRPAGRPIRVIGHGDGASTSSRSSSTQQPLRAAMLEFSRNILILSLIISGITASLVYLRPAMVIVRPVRRLSGNIAAFAGDPEDASRVITPSDRDDEIGVAEQALARMEAALAQELRQKRRLAELGLAVSKINHELRNMLTTAQLLTDRLERVSDGAVQRVAPRLVATLGRAIAFCEATLAYGRATERAAAAPAVSRSRRSSTSSRTCRASRPAPASRSRPRCPTISCVDADPDQLSRVLVNLVRNAVQALSQAGSSNGPPQVTRRGAPRGDRASRSPSRTTAPACRTASRRTCSRRSRARRAAAAPGLGLAIAAELVRAARRHASPSTTARRAPASGW